MAKQQENSPLPSYLKLHVQLEATEELPKVSLHANDAFGLCLFNAIL